MGAFYNSSLHPFSGGRCLVICHKQLGDLLLLAPALASLAAQTDLPIEILTRSGHAPLLSLLPHVQPAARIRGKFYSHLIAYDASNKTTCHALGTFAAQKGLILRAESEWKRWHSWIFQRIHAPGLHENYLAHYYWQHTPVHTPFAFIPPKLQQPPIAWQPPAWEDQHGKDAPYLLLNPTSGWKRKCWHIPFWIQTLQNLLKAGIPKILITSGPEPWQIDHAYKIAAPLGSQVQFLGGQTDLKTFLWLIAHACTVLTVDGSASHLAAAFGRKSLTLFLTTPMHHWHYPTSQSHALQGIHPPCDPHLPTAQTLSPDQVSQATLKLWRNGEDPEDP